MSHIPPQLTPSHPSQLQTKQEQESRSGGGGPTPPRPGAPAPGKILFPDVETAFGNSLTCNSPARENRTAAKGLGLESRSRSAPNFPGTLPSFPEFPGVSNESSARER